MRVQSLTILYDPDCGLCDRVRGWLHGQPALVPVKLLATGSDAARAAFPQLPPGELAVVADTGEVWLGNRAWIVCLWALRDYRSLAFRLTAPGLLRLAREAFSAVSRNRHALSRLLQLRDDRDLEHQLGKEIVPPCPIRPK